MFELILFVVSALAGVWVAYDSSLSWPIFLTLLGSIGLFLAIANSLISPRLTAQGLITLAGLVALYFVGQYAHFDYQDEVVSLARLGQTTGSLLPNLVFFTPQPNAGDTRSARAINLCCGDDSTSFIRIE